MDVFVMPWDQGASANKLLLFHMTEMESGISISRVSWPQPLVYIIHSYLFSPSCMAGTVLGAEIESWQSPSPHPAGVHILMGLKKKKKRQDINTTTQMYIMTNRARNLQKNEREKIHREGIGSEVAEFSKWWRRALKIGGCLTEVENTEY